MESSVDKIVAKKKLRTNGQRSKISGNKNKKFALFAF